VRVLVAAAASVAVSAWVAWDGHDVRDRSRRVRDAPVVEAHARAPELAAGVQRDLNGALGGSQDVVLGHFYILPAGSPAGTLTTGDDAFAGEVARSLVAPLRADASLTAAIAWRTEPFAGGPALVAARRGDAVEGFVIDRASLTSRLAAHAGSLVAELHADASAGLPIVPGWQLAVSPNPLAVRQARADAADLVRDFEIRAGVVAVVMLLGWSIVLARRR
jgi:hypothetical protein